MKTVILKVEVPDGFEFHKRIEACNMQPGFARRFELLELTEITLPSEADILEANRKSNANRFIHGAHWVKKFILNQIK
jgi:hypothetical protein